MVVSLSLVVVTMALFIGTTIVTIAALYWMKKKKMTPKTVTEEEGNFFIIQVLIYGTLTFFYHFEAEKNWLNLFPFK